MSAFTTRRIREGGSYAPQARPATPKEPAPPTDPQRRVRILKRILIALAGILAFLIILSGLVSVLLATRVLTVGGFLRMTAAPLPEDESGFTNILLLGQGDESHDGVDLTDTIIVASIDAHETKSVSMLSIPRDLYLQQTENMGAGRINAMVRDYKSTLRFREQKSEEEASLFAMEELRKEIGALLGREIHRVVKIDFIGFVEAVDALGGIDVDVPFTIVDTQYPGPNYSYQTFIIQEGPQHLDGATALKYARSRHTTSDFDRSARQQQLLAALGTKAKERGILGSVSRVTKLLKIISEHMETTMTVQEMLGLAALGRRIESGNLIAMQLNTSSGVESGSEPGGFLYTPPRDQFQGASVLLPVESARGPFAGIQTLMKLLLEERAIYLRNPTISVLNAGARSSLGSVLGGELIRYGFAVEKISNASLPDSPRSWVSYAREEDKAAAEFFGKLLRLPVESLPLGLEEGEAAQVTIFLGEEYERTAMTELVLPIPE